MREAPSRDPLLFQDVVGLAQGLLGGGAQVKFLPGIPQARLRGEEGEGLVDTAPRLETNDTWKLPADNRSGVTQGAWAEEACHYQKEMLIQAG